MVKRKCFKCGSSRTTKILSDNQKLQSGCQWDNPCYLLNSDTAHKIKLHSYLLVEGEKKLFVFKKFCLNRSLSQNWSMIFEDQDVLCQVLIFTKNSCSRWCHPVYKGVTHTCSEISERPLFSDLSRTILGKLPPISCKNKENFAFKNTPFFTKN